MIVFFFCDLDLHKQGWVSRKLMLELLRFSSCCPSWTQLDHRGRRREFKYFETLYPIGFPNFKTLSSTWYKWLDLSSYENWKVQLFLESLKPKCQLSAYDVNVWYFVGGQYPHLWESGEGYTLIERAQVEKKAGPFMFHNWILFQFFFLIISF